MMILSPVHLIFWVAYAKKHWRKPAHSTKPYRLVSRFADAFCPFGEFFNCMQEIEIISLDEYQQQDHSNLYFGNFGLRPLQKNPTAYKTYGHKHPASPGFYFYARGHNDHFPDIFNI